MAKASKDDPYDTIESYIEKKKENYYFMEEDNFTLWFKLLFDQLGISLANLKKIESFKLLIGEDEDPEDPEKEVSYSLLEKLHAMLYDQDIKVKKLELALDKLKKSNIDIKIDDSEYGNNTEIAKLKVLLDKLKKSNADIGIDDSKIESLKSDIAVRYAKEIREEKEKKEDKTIQKQSISKNHWMNLFWFHYFDLDPNQVFPEQDYEENADEEQADVFENIKKTFFISDIRSCYLLDKCFEGYIAISESEELIDVLYEVARFSDFNHEEKRLLANIFQTLAKKKAIQNFEPSKIALFSQMKDVTEKALSEHELSKDKIWEELSGKLYAPCESTARQLWLWKLEDFAKDMTRFPTIDTEDWEILIAYLCCTKEDIDAIQSLAKRIECDRV